MIWIIVWILTIITLFLGSVVGYLIGSKKLDRKITQLKNRINPPSGSGPIKPYTKEELEVLESTDKKRMKELGL